MSVELLIYLIAIFAFGIFYVYVNVYFVNLILNHWNGKIIKWSDELIGAFNSPKHLIFTFVFFCLLIWSVLNLRDTINLFEMTIWWFLAVMFGFTGIIVSIPDIWWIRCKHCLQRVAIPVSIFLSGILWYAFGSASSEINSIFGIPANLLPSAVVALTFFNCAVLCGLPLAAIILISEIFLIVLWPIASYKNKLTFDDLIPLAGIALIFTISLITFYLLIGSAQDKTYKLVIASIALNFDFDEKTVCINSIRGGRFIFLDNNKMQLLQVIVPNPKLTREQLIVAIKDGYISLPYQYMSVINCNLL